MNQKWTRMILAAAFLGTISCGGSSSTGSNDNGLGDDLANGGNPDGNNTGNVTPGNADIEKVKAEFLAGMDVLSKEMNAVTQATCATNSPKAALDVLRAFVRELVGDYILKAMENDFISVLGGAMDLIGGTNPLTEVAEASSLTGYVIKQLQWIIGSLLGPTAFDPICINGAPRWGLKYEGAEFAKKNLISDDLIINKAPGTFTVKTDPERLCTATFGQGTQAVWKDLVPVCKEILTNGKPRLTVTLGAANELSINIKLADGAVQFIDILVSADRKNLKTGFDFTANAMAVVTAAGFGKFFGQPTTLSGKLDIELALAGTGGHDGTVVKLSLPQPLVINPKIVKDGKDVAIVDIRLSNGVSEGGQGGIVAGIEKSGKLMAYDVALGKVVIAIKPLREGTKIGPMEFEIARINTTAEAFGKPLLTKVNNLAFGSTIFWKSSGKQVCNIDVNKASGYKVSASIRDDAGTYKMTATPGLSIQADCKPGTGVLPAGFDPLFKSYSFQFPAGEFALSAENTFLLDLLAQFIAQ